MKSIQLSTLFLVVTLLFSCSSNEDVVLQNETKINTKEKLSERLNTILSTKDVNGFAVNIAENNTILYQEAFGYANVSQQQPYTNTSLTNIASVSKTFVAAATLKAIENGLFTMETDINSLLPVDIINPKKPNANIKIKHLLTHTSGIVDVPETYLATSYFIKEGENTSGLAASILMNQVGIQQMEQVALEEYLAEVLLEDGDLYNEANFLDATPGTQWMYSNTATALLSYIISEVSEMSFAAFVNQTILNPLQMTSSSFDSNQLNTSNLVTYYMDKTNAFPRYGNHTLGDGSMHTTNLDLGRYLVVMLQGASGNSSALFSSTQNQKLFKNHLDSSIIPSDFADEQALFWYIKDEKIMHGGNSFGVSTHIEFANDGSSGFTLISNMDGTFVQNIDKWQEVKTLISNAINEYLTYKN